MTDQVTIEATWRSRVVIDQEDVEADLSTIDWDNLSAWPPEVADMVTTQGAELVDWDATPST